MSITKGDLEAEKKTIERGTRGITEIETTRKKESGNETIDQTRVREIVKLRGFRRLQIYQEGQEAMSGKVRDTKIRNTTKQNEETPEVLKIASTRIPTKTATRKGKGAKATSLGANTINVKMKNNGKITT
jgi:hypothetical protein